MKTEDILKIITDTLNNKKATNVQAFDVKKLTPFYDYMLIASTSNSNHVKSLISHVNDLLKQYNKKIRNIEKDDSYNWIIIDCSDFIIHIFLESTRKFYNLENIWADANKIY